MRTMVMVAAALFASVAGLGRAHARYYSAATANFLEPDRAGMPDGPNRYAYAADNPTNRADPTGNYIIPTDGSTAIMLANLESSTTGWVVAHEIEATPVFVYLGRENFGYGGVGQPTTVARTHQVGSAGSQNSCSLNRVAYYQVNVGEDDLFTKVNELTFGEMQLEPSDELGHEFAHVLQYMRGQPQSEQEADGVEYLVRGDRSISVDGQALFRAIKATSHLGGHTPTDMDLNAIGSTAVRKLAPDYGFLGVGGGE